VPPAFQDLYTQLDTDLINFNATLATGGGGPSPTLWTGSLKAANGNIGPQLIAGQPGMLLQLQALKAMGAQAIMVQVGFPVLWEPFLTSQGQSYSAFAAYYQGVAVAVRQAGLKLVVENDTLLSSDVQAGWGSASFYATLNWTQYQQARAQMALTVAQLMQPDYMVVLEEPSTEANNSGQTQVNTPTGSASMLSQILTSVSQSGVPGLKVGAGTLTTQTNALGFVQQYVLLPVDFIDIHIYPVNNSFLTIALQIATTAAAAGKPVSMSECWMSKVRDSELNAVPMDTIRARNPFSFWAPLDSYFVQTMQNLASYTQMLFMDPFGAEYYFAYQDYNDTTSGMPPDEILGQESSLVSQANQQALYTSTGLSYYRSLLKTPDATPPTVPTGLSGVSANPDTASVSWNAATDNVGVAGYYVFRDGKQAAQTGTLYFQDTGLAEASTHTYAVQAFDLAGNVSPMSATISVQTSDITPPTVPGNLVGKAVSCYKATLSWSASTDNSGVSSYIVFWGLTPGSLTQVAMTAGKTTSYGNSTLSPGTINYFGVEAQDTRHNVSAMSAIVAVTTPVVPGAPASLSATPLSTSKISLSWPASVGGLPIGHYAIYRGTSAASLSPYVNVLQTTYTDTSLAVATTYYYAVQAADSGTPPAQSGLSPVASAKTFSAPSQPVNLKAAPSSCTRVTLTWSASTGGGAPISYYQVLRGSSANNLSAIGNASQATYYDTSLTASTTYYYAVAAVDSAGDVSSNSAVVPATMPALPTAPTGLVATPISVSKISLSWSASGGGLPVQYYQVLRGSSPANLVVVGNTTQTAYMDSSLTASTKYYYAVTAVNTGGDTSANSPVVWINTPALPSAPAALAATALSTTKVGLSWSAGAAGVLSIQYYQVLRGSSPSNLVSLGNTTLTSYTDISLTPSTKYYYAVAAVDTGGDVSPNSQVVPVTTLALPSAPTGLTATAASKVTINLAWTAAQSGMPLSSYTIYRGSSPSSLVSVKVVSGSKTTAVDNPVSPGTTYYYGVQATDTGGNISPMSALAQVTTSN
jgi:fibronectin type 3 domain-containing protein